MFEVGQKVASEAAPMDPRWGKSMAGNESLIPSSAYMLRGEVAEVRGEELVLVNVERNAYISGGPYFDSASAWFRSASENGSSFTASIFVDDTDHSFSNQTRVVL